MLLLLLRLGSVHSLFCESLRLGGRFQVLARLFLTVWLIVGMRLRALPFLCSRFLAICVHVSVCNKVLLGLCQKLHSVETIYTGCVI